VDEVFGTHSPRGDTPKGREARTRDPGASQVGRLLSGARPGECLSGVSGARGPEWL